MNNRRRSHLWLAFVMFVSGVMLFSSLLIMPIYLFAESLNPGLLQGPRPLMAMFSLLLAMMFIGAAVSALSGQRVVNPFAEISHATQRVAKGDFSVRIRENYRMREMRELAANFNKMVRELSGIETLRNDFVTNVSHEFKTPLAAIEGYASLLRNGDLTKEEYDEYTRMIIEAAQQLSSLTGNILKISRLENQQFVCEKSRFSLDEQLRQALLLLETQWSEKRLELDIRLPKLDYYGSEELLLQVWLNILNNAVKFTETGGRLMVAMSESSREVQVTVADSGCGMDAETVSHIFEKFYQGEGSHSYSGNGLGLSLVKRILDLCGGTVRVESAPGQGSVFTVTLPKTEPASPEPGRRSNSKSDKS